MADKSEQDPPRTTASINAKRGTAAIRPRWKDLQARFLQYAAEHSELSAVWSWVYPPHVLAESVARAVSQGPNVDPYDVLRRAYRDPGEAARPPAPVGQWSLQGGSVSQDLFRVIAGQAVGRLGNSCNAEPWRLWLDRLREEGYAPEMPTRGKSGQVLGSYPEGFEDRRIEHVFKVSADFCFVRSLADAAALAAQHSQVIAEGAMADDSDRTSLKNLTSTFEKSADAASAEGVYAGSLIAPEEHAVAGGHESAPSPIRTQALGQEREPRPEVCFVRWGPMDGEPTPLRLSHTGFLLANDGLAAHDLEIADFAVGDESWTAEKLARIKRDGEEVVLVSSRAAQKWNLLGAMHNAWSVRAEDMRDHSNYTVRVFARYRDAANIWYQSWADLTYIPNQGPSLGRLRFGATAFEYAGVTKGSAIATREQTSPVVETFPDRPAGTLPKQSGGRQADSLFSAPTLVGKSCKPSSALAAFPKRGIWLSCEMKARNNMTAYRLHKAGGPDPKTVKKILQGEKVREAQLDMIATGLSYEGSKVSRNDIPDQ